ncbi:glycosyltransferase family 2 protein [Streptomyces anthocyanicus]|uniref:glycosyltransferase family 2 protein n=1 Tax=Streptomyces anthocyanicus TaxID=68174 RepID=UPI002F90BF1C|nr:glycosyltransferase family 2 protein [Streptomyces anthocyanicus]
MPFPTGREATVAFVVPYFDDGLAWRREYLRLTLASLERQSDTSWCAYLVDDASPAHGTREFLDRLAATVSGTVTVLHAQRNAGAGQARNLAIEAAHRDGHPLVAYLDADDLAHPNRVAAVRALFAAEPELDFAYNDIEFIDERGRPWAREGLLPGLRMLDEQQRLPKLRGRERWVEQAVERDNIAIPSAMNLRTELARRVPFPAKPFCEDVSTLFRYLGSGAAIDHVPGIPSGYRVPREGGSASRRQSGGVDAFNRMRCANEREGLEEAIACAVSRGAADERTGRAVLCRYLIRIGRTVTADGSPDLGRAQLRQARDLDPKTFAEHATAVERAETEADRAAP